MNTNQIVPMAGGVQVSRKTSALRQRNSADYGARDGSFNDVLAKSKGDSLTLQDVKELANSAQAAEKEMKSVEAAEGASTEANTPKEVKSENTGDDKIASADAKTESTSDAMQAEAGVLAVALSNLNMEGDLPQTQAEPKNIELKPELKEFVGKDTANYNLQTILPQSEQISGKNKEMLAMLSGQHIPKQEGNIDLKALGFKSEDLANLPEETSTAPTLLRGRATDPLSALANDMAKFAKNAETGVLGEPVVDMPIENIGNAKNPMNIKLVENSGVVINNIDNVDIVDNIGNSKNNNPNILTNVNIGAETGEGNKLNNANNLKNIGEVVGVDVKAENAEVKAQNLTEAASNTIRPNAKVIETKAQPLVAALQNTKPTTDNQASVLQNDITVDTVDTDNARLFPIREGLGNFNSNSDSNENPSLFNNNGGDIFKEDGVLKTGAENNGQFAHAIEAQNIRENSAAREAAPMTAAPRDDYNVREQIVQQARLIRAENGSEMVIRLKPEHLGEMTLRISVSSEGSVTASFFTNNAEVRHIVENSLVQLRQELQNQGIKVDKTEVYSGLSDGNLPQGQGQEAWQQNRGRNYSGSRFQNSEIGAAQFEDSAVDTSANNRVSTVSDDGVDYLV